MSVADGDDTTATSGSESVGVPQHLLTETDFIGVRAALVRLVGNDGNRALILTRILWRADSRWREAVAAGGSWWWRATYDTIADETGLTKKQVERCLRWLLDAGMVEAEAHHIEGPYDQTRSYRVVVASHLPESGDDSAESGDVHRAESGNVPLTETFKTAPATLDGFEEPKPRTRKKSAIPIPEDWQPTDAHQQIAKQRNLDLGHEAQLFRDHAEANDRRLVSWNAGFRMWLNKSTPGTGPATGARPPAGPVLPPAPRFPIANAGDYDPNYLQPRSLEQQAADAAEQDAFRERMMAHRRAAQQ